MKDLIMIAVLCFLLGFVVCEMIHNIYKISVIPTTLENKAIESADCDGLDILATSECLRSELMTFYHYNLSNVGKDLNFNELKEIGGVCKHYAEWYRDQFLNLGAEEYKQGDVAYKKKDISKFYVTLVKMVTNNETSHVITIASNNDKYCILDQSAVECWEFKK